MNLSNFTRQLNQWGRDRRPFIFLTDFELQNPLAFPLSGVDPSKLRYQFNGKSNYDAVSDPAPGRPLIRVINEPSREAYQAKFDQVIGRIRYGDSFLVNLTVKSEIRTEVSLSRIFDWSEARFKLWSDNQFVVFSPEPFVTIRDQKIASYPMKGTIDASLPDAANRVLSNSKELAEHVTIVDLIRNDLSRVARDVNVRRFRYLDRIKTDRNELLQVSSEIVGTLEPSWHDSIGKLLTTLLPAGSVSGAPKPMTLRIIREVEGEPRGYYTGVMGIYDGEHLESAVMIRFIERNGDRFYYRSGGGITAQSAMEDEYLEARQKVYVPLPATLLAP